ncbi:MAG: UDP-N-acetylmuramoyl-L-alanyl-D-glutamate--2,6-diaminopimelate ligase [Bdellovibrionales bacterium]|nr:UDP-N-acetylmuramoyl-L-alanyl-D-glutamate--2,6-diaminopimelate ligase [Bdellovibrionales bacterium]
MKVAQLFSQFASYSMGEAADQDVTELCLDSRLVKPGSVYVAIVGHSQDGHDYIASAIERGAIGLVVQSRSQVPDGFRGAVVEVKSSREALVSLATIWFGAPAADLFCVGVTGTNGKTTVSYMVEQVLTAHGWKTGVLGTIDHHLADRVWDSQLTTPDALTLQRRLKDFADLKAQAAVFEVSSHALEQKRADGLPFDAAIFTNLSRDHLDYHKTMQAYFEAKSRLFVDVLPASLKPSKKCIINTDDEWGRKLKQMVPMHSWAFGKGPSDLQFEVVQSNLRGSEVKLKTPRGSAEFQVPLVGEHNVYNAVAAIGVGLIAGASLNTLTSAIEAFDGVPGRMQRVRLNGAKAPQVFVDYAHTPDALERALKALKEALGRSPGAGRLISLFGCGGDRDKGKRAMMGDVASRLSDQTVVTSDNPRSEPPDAIIQDILQGVDPSMRQVAEVQPDRRLAILHALQIAGENDVILVAGKGHESTQAIGAETFEFLDSRVILECFDQLERKA